MIQFTTKQLKSIASKLKMETRNGKHINAKLKENGKTIISTCWSHGNKTIPKGTASKIMKHQFLVDKLDDAIDLRDCPMSRDMYIDLLRQKEVIG